MMNTHSLGLRCVKVVALGVSDSSRARHFYGDTLGLPPCFEGDEQVGYDLGGTTLMLKEDGSLAPTDHPDPRITLQVEAARETEAALRERHVTISDPVQRYGDYLVGAFLDSEGNKLWFCADH